MPCNKSRGTFGRDRVQSHICGIILALFIVYNKNNLYRHQEGDIFPHIFVISVKTKSAFVGKSNQIYKRKVTFKKSYEFKSFLVVRLLCSYLYHVPTFFLIFFSFFLSCFFVHFILFSSLFLCCRLSCFTS